ncbi:MAG: DUF1559 domain-containing protein, partial [Planctomycetota bacterium]|nr:DUF1559 domain-containing protein [Planctomycetota bacterium]
SAKIGEVTDGTSQTLAIGEGDILDENDPLYSYSGDCPNRQCHVGYMWPAWSIVTTFYGINQNPTFFNAGIQSSHAAGSNFLFADGHISMVSKDIEQELLIYLTTRNGGEAIDGSRIP